MVKDIPIRIFLSDNYLNSTTKPESMTFRINESNLFSLLSSSMSMMMQ